MSFWDDIKKMAQPYAADDDYDDYDDEELDEGYESQPAPRYTAPVSEPAPAPAPFTNSAPSSPSGFNATVLGGSSTSNKQQMVLVRPESFADCPSFAANLRNKKAIVLNLEGVDKALARRVVDFLSGCTFAVDGSVKKIGQASYVFCPYNMEVLGDLKNIQGEVESYV